MKHGKSIDELSVGDTSSTFTKISSELIEQFGQVTGDVNPIHMDEEYANNTVFKGRIAHGIFSLGLISAVIANKLPGVGAIYLSQTARFMRPAMLGDTVKAEVSVTDINKEKNTVTLRTTCYNGSGDMLMDGEAVVLAPRNESLA